MEQYAEQNIATEHTDCDRSASGLSHRGDDVSSLGGLGSQNVVIGAVKRLA